MHLFIAIFVMSASAMITNAQSQTVFGQGLSYKIENCHLDQPKITFSTQTIFDETEAGIFFIHRWANAIHIDTKQLTLENEAAFFINKCHKSQADLAELERHLRSRKYLRDAKVSSDDALKNITITTWDNWSLLPTLSLGRQGGESKYSFGIKERNLLGLGIDAEIETYQNSQRKGYKFKTTIPLFSQSNIDLTLRFADNNDGTQQSLFLQKYFASFYTKNAFLIGFNEEGRNDTLYQNGDKLTVFSHNINYLNAEFAWLKFNHKNALLRYRFGITQDQHKFANINQNINNPHLLQLPLNRDFIYPWLGLSYIEKDFKKLTNIHLISQIEDFNHGWQLSGRIGISDGERNNGAWALFQTEINKGFEIHDNALILLNISLDGDIYHQQANRLLFKIDTEYFYNFNDNWGYYFNNTNVISKNQYLDTRVTVGGNTGLRGFPLEYQHGERSVKLTHEIRYYPNINLFKVFDLAGAAFIDAGRAFGHINAQGAQGNTEKNWLYSVGMGARFYSPHSAGNQQVIHIDFAFPQSDNANIDTFEIRVEAKQSF